MIRYNFLCSIFNWHSQWSSRCYGQAWSCCQWWWVIELIFSTSRASNYLHTHSILFWISEHLIQDIEALKLIHMGFQLLSLPPFPLNAPNISLCTPKCVYLWMPLWAIINDLSCTWVPWAIPTWPSSFPLHHLLSFFHCPHSWHPSDSVSLIFLFLHICTLVFLHMALFNHWWIALYEFLWASFS